MKTNYGIKRKGKSRFIIVAPHAAGPDLYTKELSQGIAKQLNASVTINTKYHKKRKDFNKLPWNRRSESYDWNRKCKPMKKFYYDVEKFINKKSAIVAYIHGMRRRWDKKGNGIGIDIGFGVKYDGKILKGTRGKNKHPDADGNTGVRRADERDMRKLSEVLERKLECLGLKVTIAEFFPAWDRRNAIQFHTGEKKIASFQLEVASNLRGAKEKKRERKKKIEVTAKIIAEALKSVYI